LRKVVGIPSDRLLIPSPNEIKKFATTKGNATKDVMVAALPKDVAKLFAGKNLKKTTGLTDVTDAYWIAELLRARYMKQQTRTDENK
jgi:N-acetyl-gamma-glutamylphosphate reductase